MFRRHYALVAFCCIPTIGLLSAGCGEDEKATPQAIFDGAITRGAGTQNCQDSAKLFSVGTFGEPALQQPSQPRKDGDSEGQGKVSIACSVKQSGDGFAVDATVNLTGPVGGLFHVDGVFKPTGTQEGIHAIFSSRETTNTYEQTDRTCTVVYETSYQGVALGRVWGRIDCPNAALSGTAGETTCAANATFRFENCAQ